MANKGVNECIRDLWKNNFFITARAPKDIREEIFSKYRVTSSQNIIPHLISCSSFLRRQNSAWIQKYPYEENESSVVNITKKSIEKDANLFDVMKIHSAVRKASEKLYTDKHYDMAIFEALKKVNNLVKEKSKSKEDGKSLMMAAFNEKHPFLQFNDIVTDTEKDIQEGRKFLFAGAIMAIRNPRAHDDVIQKNPVTDHIIAMQYLSYASLLADYLDEAYVSKK